MSKGVAILGSTGSIGRSALDLIERLNSRNEDGNGSPRFRVVSLAAGRNVERLAEQIRRFDPDVAAIGAPELLPALTAAVGSVRTRLVAGEDGLVEAAVAEDAAFVLAGIVGAAGLKPTFAAVEAGRTIGLANKEALVMAGPIMLEAAARSGSTLLPVDSEHNALHQCLRGERITEVRRLVLTASGGPFLRRPASEFSRITPEEALAHPTWVMGPKISIDSATLMNKGLEVIEARWLFGVDPERIHVLVHPRSIVHSMVEFLDGSVICQMGVTDMRHPIQYALTWPDRHETPLAPLDLTTAGELTFHEPDRGRFPCLDFGWRALEAGGSMPAVINAANEIAVAAFLSRRIPFTGIPEVIESVASAHNPVVITSLDDVFEADAWAREAASLRIGQHAAVRGGSPPLTSGAA